VSPCPALTPRRREAGSQPLIVVEQHQDYFHRGTTSSFNPGGEQQVICHVETVRHTQSYRNSPQTLVSRSDKLWCSEFISSFLAPERHALVRLVRRSCHPSTNALVERLGAEPREGCANVPIRIAPRRATGADSRASGRSAVLREVSRHPRHTAPLRRRRSRSPSSGGIHA